MSKFDIIAILAIGFFEGESFISDPFHLFVHSKRRERSYTSKSSCHKYSLSNTLKPLKPLVPTFCILPLLDVLLLHLVGRI